jgi:hypothetical protein
MIPGLIKGTGELGTEMRRKCKRTCNPEGSEKHRQPVGKGRVRGTTYEDDVNKQVSTASFLESDTERRENDGKASNE